ncbi:cobalt-precorrin-5B (C(1))-methyltransferase CbiD [Spirochaeta cellobiosiphila]|uniref:cobalt-precorrin-5B (C(1))-methyltransferase CbiD n=1 Tax=Spirochaeta cellobiosiphila TaxID=504483 RepID=UPI0003FD5D45|nr:cobalt-precorrin-5B (C(1))-methyltransferase CbiD [Spirochaeta cellobiosiphila]
MNYKEVLGSVEGKRRGYTTGTTAQAAVKAALQLLILGKTQKDVSVTLPSSSRVYSGKTITIPLAHSELNSEYALVTVVKDSGDDKDDTNGIEITAQVSWNHIEGIQLTGGTGIGMVTGEGLPIPPGEAAINPVPRKMIYQEVMTLLNENQINRGVNIQISAPEGVEMALKTWNPKVGVQGGISIIGTTGVVEPYSEKAFLTSLGIVIRATATQRQSLVICSGYVGDKFLGQTHIPDEAALSVGDFIGFALEQCLRRGITELLIPFHIGKLTKVAAGMFNTHSQYGDARLETIAACLALAGGSSEQVRQILDLSLAEEAVTLIENWHLNSCFNYIAQRAQKRCYERLDKYLTNKGEEAHRYHLETIVLDLKGRPLGWSNSELTLEALCQAFM